MPSRSKIFDFLCQGRASRGGLTFFICLLCVSLAPFSLSGEEVENSTATAKQVTAKQAAAKQESDTGDRVYVVNGATITWDFKSQQYRQPTEAQAARLAEQFSAWMQAKATRDGKRPATMADVKVETLANGMKTALLPASLMNLSMVQVNSEGHLEEVCTEAHEAPALDAVPADDTSEEEWR